MIRTVFCFTPFAVCLWWFVTFALNYRKADSAKKTLTWYAFACTLLYFCHAIFFAGEMPLALECLWTLCSLSVYPIYYLYICRLTSDTIPRWMYLFLLPALLVAMLKLVMPGEISDSIRQVVFAPQVLLVCLFGYKRLHVFDRKLASVYADVEGRSTSAVKALLIAIFVISCLSMLANVLGRKCFGHSNWVLVPIAVAFSVLQYTLCYIGYTRSFTIEQFATDAGIDVPDDDGQAVETTTEELEEIGKKIKLLMEEQKLYLQPNLKLADVVKKCGSCRTYVSNYINHTGNNFSEYINKLRVEHAKTLLANTDSVKMVVVAEDSGFTSEASFYRNFRKFTGMTPQEWLRHHGDDETAPKA